LLQSGALDWLANAYNFTALEPVYRIKIIDSVQDEFQVLKLSGPAQIRDTIADKELAQGSAFPARNEVRSFCVSGDVPSFDQASGDPGAAQLVFLPKLSLTACTDNRNLCMSSSDIGCDRSMVSQTGNVHGGGLSSLVHELCSRGWKHNDRSIQVVATGQFCRTVVHVKVLRDASLDLPNEKWIVKLLGDSKSCGCRGDWETPPTECYRGYHGCRRTDHINRNYGKVSAVLDSTFRQVVNANCVKH
jgi:hypothetical protein